jgi:hypothetical protein
MKIYVFLFMVYAYRKRRWIMMRKYTNNSLMKMKRSNNDKDGMYSPNDEDDDNSYDHDTMSEDDVPSLHQNNEVEQATLDISSGRRR